MPDGADEPDKDNDNLTCPAGCVATHSKKDLINTTGKCIFFQFTRRQCGCCKLKKLCVSALQRKS